MHNDIQEILHSEEEIQRKVKELGEILTRDFEGRNPLVICVLKGAFIFMADLVKEIRVPLEMDFMAVSSYGASTKSSGVVKIIKDLDVSVEGRDVLIVEDIIDSGLTLSYLIDVLERRNAKSVTVVTLFDKPRDGRSISMPITQALLCRMRLSWATALIMLSTTGIFPSLASSSLKSTPNKTIACFPFLA